MIKVVEEYEKYLNDLPSLIKKSYYKPEFFRLKMNLSEATYYRKIRNNSFSLEEVKLITHLLFSDEYKIH